VRRAAALLLVVLTGCGGAAASGITGKQIKPLPQAALAGVVAGLDVKTEDVSATVRQFRNSYADRVSVYSMREKGLLQATLQVSRFSDPKQLAKSSFKRGLIDDLAAGTRAQPIRVGNTDVQVARGTGQRLFVWFAGRDVFVLSIRDAYRARYALLRAVVTEVKP
jgi:hypothetical protein